MSVTTTIRTLPSARSKRRGSTYIAALGLGLILTIVGIAIVALSRVGTRSMRDTGDWAKAQQLALSAAEHALAKINSDSNWRTTYQGQTVTNSMGDGSFSWQVIDEVDGDLTDDEDEPATMMATGTVNNAEYTFRVPLMPLAEPLDLLRACLSSGGPIKVHRFLFGRGGDVRAIGGPLSANTYTRNNGADIYADVETDTYVGQYPVSGTVTLASEAKEMPADDVFESYRLQATTINPGLFMHKKVLTPETNPWGANNPKGFYYIETQHGLVIDKSRLHGTLIVKCLNWWANVWVMDNVLLENHDPLAPVLIVDGDIILEVDSGGHDLSESSCGINLNPLGAPYEGDTDADQSDTYPNEIRGLVHARGKVFIGRTTRIRGMMIAEDRIEIIGRNPKEFIHDSSIYTDPPIGYYSATRKVRPGGWSQSVD